MTPAQIDMVKSSWEKVKPIAPQAADMFYGKLFELDPDLKPLFKGDMTEQGEKLMKMITVAVNSLDKLEEVVPAVKSLGQRHSGYGVKESDYDTVGESLLWTLEQGLGDEFTAEVKGAWTEVYVTLAGTMKSAAAEQSPVVTPSSPGIVARILSLFRPKSAA